MANKKKKTTKKKEEKMDKDTEQKNSETTDENKDVEETFSVFVQTPDGRESLIFSNLVYEDVEKELDNIKKNGLLIPDGKEGYIHYPSDMIVTHIRNTNRWKQR